MGWKRSRQSRAAVVLAAALSAVVIAGCATAVTGVAEPNPAAVAALQSSTSSTSSQTSSRSTSERSTESSTSSSSDSGATRTTTSSSRSQGGSYPSTPVDIPEKPATESQARLLEARRIAGYLLTPTLILPTYTDGGGISTLPLRGPSALSVILTDPVPAVAERGGMITGFSSARSTVDNKSSVVVAALEYPSAAAATKGATDLAAAANRKERDTGKAAIPGFSKAAGWTGKSSSANYTHVFLAQGSMVLYVWVNDPSDKASTQPATVRKVLEAQTKAMASFRPVPENQLSEQPNDIDELRAYTVPNSGDNLTVVDGLYTATGQLHFDTDPVGTRKLFDDAGVDLVSQGRVNLYRAKDETGARKVQEAFITYTRGTDSSWKDFKFPGDVPGISCLQQSLNSVYYCMATLGPYAIEGSGRSESDLVAAFEAQYRLLQEY